jgi:hypothetical protein
VRLRFTGYIAAAGTASGTRIVVGHWRRSPFGPVSDLMTEDRTGHRTLYAPTAALAGFIAAPYAFDEVMVTPVEVDRSPATWSVTAGPLVCAFDVGRRPPLGLLLRAVPGPLARSTAWASLVDRPARLVLPGVRTRGTAGNARREWYGATDLHRITALRARVDGVDLGVIAPVTPAVRFGFGSTPAMPAVVAVTSTVEVGQAAQAGGSPPNGRAGNG